MGTVGIKANADALDERNRSSASTTARIAVQEGNVLGGTCRRVGEIDRVTIPKSVSVGRPRFPRRFEGCLRHLLCADRVEVH